MATRDWTEPNEAARLAEYRRLLAKILVLPGFEFTAAGQLTPFAAATELLGLPGGLNGPK